MTPLNSIQHRVHIISAQSTDFDELTKSSTPHSVMLINGMDVWLKDGKTWPTMAELNAVQYGFTNDRYTAVRIDKRLFLSDKSERIFGLEKVSLRAAFDLFKGEHLQDLMLGTQIVQWSESHVFCSGCGGVVEISKTEVAKICEKCLRTFYPHINPVVIVLITRKTAKGKELLLARGVAPRQIYSCVAGFVEAGETLEQCLVREVFEEVGVFVKNVTYFGSQPWPLPSQLMVGYTCEWESGEINMDKNEITDAQWFLTTNPLPQLPLDVSIARQMINAALKG